MRYQGFRIKFKLYTADDGEPEVKFSNQEEPDLKFWRDDGTMSFLEMLAADPESSVEKLDDGVFWQPKK